MCAAVSTLYSTCYTCQLLFKTFCCYFLLRCLLQCLHYTAYADTVNRFLQHRNVAVIHSSTEVLLRDVGQLANETRAVQPTRSHHTPLGTIEVVVRAARGQSELNAAVGSFAVSNSLAASVADAGTNLVAQMDEKRFALVHLLLLFV